MTALVVLYLALAFVVGLLVGLLIGRWLWSGGKHRSGIALRDR